MKILVVGCKGSMGLRYMAILRHLKEDVIGADQGDKWSEWDFDRAIVATPTKTHFYICRMLARMGKSFLCEKPVSMDSREIDKLDNLCKENKVDARMVCNWKYAINQAMLEANGNRGKIAIHGEMDIIYNYYDSGKDGFFWDCIQLLYMAGRFQYDRASPVFYAQVDGLSISMEDIHHSYLAMMSEWLYGNKGNLWSLEDALKANRKVEAAMRIDPVPIRGQVFYTGEMA